MHLVGNEAVRETLDQFKAEEIPPVLLFEGPAGVGKRLFAKQFIARILGGDLRVEKDLHPDVLSLDHQVDRIKQLLQDVGTFPFESPYRFYLIDGVDTMLPVQMNTLLKTFEEAPLFNRFILFATHVDRVLPTILSRAVQIHFSPLTEEQLQVPTLIARLSGGSFAKAKALVEEGFLDYCPLVLEALKYHLMRDYVQFYETIDKIHALKEGETTPELLTVLQHWLFDLYTVQTGLDRPLFFPEERENLTRCIHLRLSFAHLLTLFQKAKEGMSRHIRFSRCIEYLILNLA